MRANSSMLAGASTKVTSTGFDERRRPFDRIVKAVDGPGVSTCDDEEVVALTRVHRRLELRQHLGCFHHSLAGKVPAFLWRDLILPIC